MAEGSASQPDSAVLNHLHHTVSAQGAMLGVHEQSLHRLEEMLEGLVSTLEKSGVIGVTPASPEPPCIAAAAAPPVPAPAPDPAHISLRLVAPERSRTPAGDGGLEDYPPTTYEEFRGRFKAVFDHPKLARAASDRLMTIKHGSRSVADCSLEFRILAEQSGWKSTALLASFHAGLHPWIQAELAYRG
ncbi:hypothetical protein Z043_123684 [Scleropages formosus]|uniref:Retrotransposon gag domain-containing protein n=1 Tax=Scleropages formosus TaxID=113540 RepID=A0A0P7TCJ0_SCLFO|nr:hypothetical protein Z043_123684 [Scleropages formosus]